METIGSKILQIRKRKGLSQEELSDMAKINLRTSQRIEKGETEPRGYTLQKLCEVLEINIEDIVDYGKVEDATFLKFFHLSVLSFIIIPMGNVIIPLILWLTKRDKIIGLNSQAVDLLNYQILWSVFFYASFIIYFMNFVLHWFPVIYINVCLALLILANLVYPLYIVFSTKHGKPPKHYPSLLKFIS